MSTELASCGDIHTLPCGRFIPLSESFQSCAICSLLHFLCPLTDLWRLLCLLKSCESSISPLASYCAEGDLALQHSLVSNTHPDTLTAETQFHMYTFTLMNTETCRGVRVSVSVC